MKRLVLSLLVVAGLTLVASSAQAWPLRKNGRFFGLPVPTQRAAAARAAYAGQSNGACAPAPPASNGGCAACQVPSK